MILLYNQPADQFYTSAQAPDANTFSALMPIDPNAGRPDPIFYRTRGGETLGDVAQWYGTTVGQLLSWNGLLAVHYPKAHADTVLNAGHELVVSESYVEEETLMPRDSYLLEVENNSAPGQAERLQALDARGAAEDRIAAYNQAWRANQPVFQQNRGPHIPKDSPLMEQLRYDTEVRQAYEVLSLVKPGEFLDSDLIEKRWRQIYGGAMPYGVYEAEGIIKAHERRKHRDASIGAMGAVYYYAADPHNPVSVLNLITAGGVGLKMPGGHKQITEHKTGRGTVQVHFSRLPGVEATFRVRYVFVDMNGQKHALTEREVLRHINESYRPSSVHRAEGHMATTQLHADMPLGMLDGLSPAMVRQLNARGYRTIRDLFSLSPDMALENLRLSAEHNHGYTHPNTLHIEAVAEHYGLRFGMSTADFQAWNQRAQNTYNSANGRP